MSDLPARIIDLIIDNDPSEDKSYTPWMITKVTNGMDVDTVIESVKKAWEEKNTKSKEEIIRDITNDIPPVDENTKFNTTTLLEAIKELGMKYFPKEYYSCGYLMDSNYSVGNIKISYSAHIYFSVLYTRSPVYTKAGTPLELLNQLETLLVMELNKEKKTSENPDIEL